MVGLGLVDFVLGTVALVLWIGSIPLLLSGSWWAAASIGAAAASTWAFILLTRRLWPRWMSQTEPQSLREMLASGRRQPMTMGGGGPTVAPTRSTRVVVGAIAECISAIVIITVAAVFSFGPHGWETTSWYMAWGGIGLWAGFGMYFGVFAARLMSFVFSGANGLLVGGALLIGWADPSNPLWQYFVLGLVSVSGFVTLYGLGMLGGLIVWLSSPSDGD